MKQNILSLFLLCCSSLTLQAQAVRKADISGVIQEASGTSLVGGTVMLLAAKDSVLTSFGSTQADGGFLLKNVSAGEYLLKISYVGFATETRSLEIGAEALLNLGVIVLVPASEMLSEVEVTAEHIPIQIKKDTIEYNAESFQTQPNAVVEDLLKKLPGVEVGADGSIKAQGEDVRNVLVDGKEFFGTDPQSGNFLRCQMAIRQLRLHLERDQFVIDEAARLFLEGDQVGR